MHPYLVDPKAAEFNLIAEPFVFGFFQFQASFLQMLQYCPHVIQMLLSHQTMD
jgi:hypothetical protein